VLGDPHLPPEREKVYRRALVEQALRALTTEVTGPTLFRAEVACAGLSSGPLVVGRDPPKKCPRLYV
jgi:hypothetical protein